MFKILPKKVLIPSIIAAVAILVGSILAYQYLLPKEQTCMNSGGMVSTLSCCKLSNDFPNMCLLGPCGCAPNYSHEVKICNCGEGMCFNGNKCVSQ